MKRITFLLIVVALLLGAVNISFAQETADDEFPVDLYLDFQGVIVSLDEEAGTFLLDNGVQVTMDFTALPPDISVVIGDIVVVSGALQEDGSILADIIIESPDDTSSPEANLADEALDDEEDNETGGVVYGPGGSACDQAENCELVEDPGNEGDLEIPEGVDTIVFKAGQDYIEIEIPEDGEEVCVDGFCIVADDEGNLSYYIEDGAKDISHIQLWDVLEDVDCEANPEAEECQDDGEDVDCEANPEAEECQDDGEDVDCEANPEAEECQDDGEDVDCEANPEAEECVEGDEVSCGFGAEEGSEDDGGCHPVLVIYSEHFEVPYDELEELREENYGIGEIGRAYLLAEAAGVEVSEITALRDEGMGWGNIMKEYPDVHPSQLAPGSVIGNGRGHSVRNGGEDGEALTTSSDSGSGGAPGNSGNAPGRGGGNNGNGNGGGAPGNSGNAPGRNN